MKKFAILTAVAGMLGAASVSNGALVITGIMDGPRTGGVPKAIELYATSDIGDLSVYSVAGYFNGNTTASTTTALSGSATAGQYLYVSQETSGFEAYFGFAPNFISNAVNVNGDDAVALLVGGDVVDVFGAIGTDGTEEPWEYLDGYAYRVNGTGPSATFNLSHWVFSGIDALDGQGTSGVNGGAGVTVPFGTYQVPEPASLSLVGVAGLALLRRRRTA